MNLSVRINRLLLSLLLDDYYLSEFFFVVHIKTLISL